MTSREDLLDQYIDALNEGKLEAAELPDDPELQELIVTAQGVKAGGDIEWPEFDLAAQMSRSLQQELGPASRYVDSAARSADEVGPASTMAGGRAGSRHGDDDERNMKWYSKQFAGMAAAALIVISFGIGLAIVLGDWGGEIHEPGAFVEEGEIPGTILYVEYDGEHVEDEANQAIARIEADGTNQQELAQRPVPTADRAGLSWSPDGQWVAYVDPESGSRDTPSVITLVSADGSETETIDMEPVEGVMRLTAGLTWADDGNHLALVHDHPDTEQYRIAVVHRPTGEVMSTAEEEEVTGNQSHPAWKPGALALAYSELGPDGDRTIFLKEGERPPEAVVEDDPRAIQPDWSPGGTSLTYVGSSDDGERGNVHVVDLQTGETENITNHQERADYMPTWSSRNQIAFMSDHGDMHYDVFIVNPDGSELRNVTEEIDWGASIPDWSEDGRYLTFTTVSPDQDQWRINVYDVDEERLYTVKESENPLYHAQWQPEADPDDVYEPEETPEAEARVGEPSETVLALLEQQAEQFISDEEDPVAITVNGREVTAGQIESNQATAAISQMMMQELVDERGDMEPWIADQNTRRVALIDEYGVENVGLGTSIMQAAVQSYAEEHDLVATDEQIDDVLEQQREAHEVYEEQDPEGFAAFGSTQIDVIGEERYWEEYMPEALASSITEQNVNEHVWAVADVEAGNDFAMQQRREHYLAEYRAELVETADIEVLDEDGLGGADVERAIEYITDALPELEAEILEGYENLAGDQPTSELDSAYPQVPRDGLQAEAHVERYVQELFERQGYPDAELLEIRETIRESIGVQDWATQMMGEPDDLIWEVDTAGFIPELLADEPGPDGEPPEPENVETTLWIDPLHGVLPVFDATDVTQ